MRVFLLYLVFAFQHCSTISRYEYDLLPLQGVSFSKSAGIASAIFKPKTGEIQTFSAQLWPFYVQWSRFKFEVTFLCLLDLCVHYRNGLIGCFVTLVLFSHHDEEDDGCLCHFTHHLMCRAKPIGGSDFRSTVIRDFCQLHILPAVNTFKFSCGLVLSLGEQFILLRILIIWLLGCMGMNYRTTGRCFAEMCYFI